MQSDIQNLVSKINKRRLTNNTQRALLALLTSKSEWVARTAMRIPSIGARIRDLRKAQFGRFTVQCASANRLERRTRRNSARQTFYRLDPNSVTAAKVARVFKGVIATSNTK
jgi:hypothetical protein